MTFPRTYTYGVKLSLKLNMSDLQRPDLHPLIASYLGVRNLSTGGGIYLAKCELKPLFERMDESVLVMGTPF